VRTLGDSRSLAALVVGNVLGGVGVASGIAVGSLLVVSMSGTAFAGLGQALSVLGAGLLAVPLATLAARHGRRVSLGVGFALAAVGAALVLAAAAAGSLALLLVGLVAFGAAQATTLQTRYAASDLANPDRRGTAMSIVIWATTVGSVAGPNLSGPGGALGAALGLPRLSGPYLFSLAGFVLAGWAVTQVSSPRRPVAPAGGRPPPPVPAPRALAWAAGHPVARFAVVLLVTAHAVMVGVMSMTPVHLGHGGHPLEVIGLVISLHILGMYALSPVFGWLADRAGPMRVALLGLVTLGAAAGLVFAAPGDLGVVMGALTLLGLGWSASMIASSVLLAGVDSGEVRVPLQGATDALMNYGGAAAALLAGVLLSAVGFGGVALAAAALVVPAAATGWIARSSRRVPGDAPQAP